MSRVASSARGLLAALVLSLALSACVVAPGPGGYTVGWVSAAPPAPLFEPVGPPPRAGWFWVNGSWRWTGNRYAWNRGYWQAPRTGYRWVPNRWDRGPQGWHATPGHWQPR